MRVSGLSSGFDWEDLVHQLMEVEKRPLVLLQNQVKRLDTEKEAWRNLNSSLLGLKTKAEALSAPSLWDRMSAVSSNPAAATAAADVQAEAGTYSVNVQTLAQAHRVASARQADTVEGLGLEGQFTLQGAVEAVTIQVEATDSLRDIRDKIASSDAGAEAYILDGRLIIGRSETGPEELLFSDPDGILEALGLVEEGEFAHVLAEAQEAVFTVDGLTVTRSTNQVDDLIDGVTLNLGAVGLTEIVIDSDLDSMVEAVEAFVGKYNAVNEQMRSKSSREQGGALVGDGTLRRLTSDLRQTLSGTIGEAAQGNYSALFQIGLSAADQTGRLEFSREEFLKAWEDDRESVKNLLTVQEGAFAQMSSRLDQVTRRRGLIDSRTDSLDRRQSLMVNQMERMEQRLELRQASMFREFEALELALSRMQTQSAWLNQQLSGLSGGQ